MKERIKAFFPRIFILLILGLFIPFHGTAKDLIPVCSSQNNIQVQSTPGFAVLGDRCYFVGKTPESSQWLYVYDGLNTPKPAPGLTENPGITGLTVFNNQLYFSANQGIYSYDGLNPPALISPGTFTRALVVFKNKLVFAATDAHHGEELWQCDGIHPATLLQDIQAGPESSMPGNFHVAQDKLYFSATTALTGTEIFVYDAVNPIQVEVDIFPGPSSSYPQKMKAFDGKLYFWLGQKNHTQLWSYDFVNPPAKVANTAIQSSSDLVVFNNQLYYFSLNNPNGPELRAFDGVNPPTVANQAQQNPTQKNAGPFTEAGGKLFFGTQDNNGIAQLWACNSANSVSLAAEVPPSSTGDTGIQEMFQMKGTVYVATENELYKYASETLTLTSPNGGEEWYSGTTHTITWSLPDPHPESFYSINLYYSTDNGTTWNTVAEWLPDSLTSYEWTVPSSLSTSCRFKISDPYDNFSDISDNTFSIVNPLSLTITYPNGGEQILPGSILTVLYTTQGNVTNEHVAVEYSLDGGNSWHQTPTHEGNTVPMDWGQLQFQLPDLQSPSCLVRVSETTGNGADTSDAVFSVVGNRSFWNIRPYFEILMEGDTYPIQWGWGGFIDTVKLEYSTDGQTTWHLISAATPNTGTYSWTVPDIPNNSSRQCFIRISDLEGTTFSEAWDASPFFILSSENKIPLSERNALIAFYNATGGNQWVSQSNWRHPDNPAQFNDHGTELLWDFIGLNEDCTHVTEISITHDYNLTGSLPDLSGLPYLTTLTISNNTRLNYSNLGTLPALTALKFYNNKMTGPLPILANYPALTSVDIHRNLFTGPFPDLSTLPQLKTLRLTENCISGSIPSSLGDLTQLRSIDLSGNKLQGVIPDTLLNLTDTSIYLDSNALYTYNDALRDKLRATGYSWEGYQTIAPTGLTAANATTNSVQLTWNPVANQYLSGGYQIYRSTTPGNGYQLIATLTSKSQTTYTATDLVDGNTYYFRLNTFSNWWSYNPNIVTSDYSTEVPVTTSTPDSITITSPNGGETAEVNSYFPITWTSSGNIGEIEINVSTDGGNSWTQFATVPNTGTHNWLVPAAPYDNCLMAIRSSVNSVLYDQSDAVFSITPTKTINITTPFGAQYVNSGSVLKIGWSYTGVISAVKIEYRTNPAESWIVITNSTPNTGTYNWTVPNGLFTSCQLKISDATGTASGTTLNTFIIAPARTITITSPNGGENFDGNDYYQISWTHTGLVHTYTLHYSLDGGANWSDIGSVNDNNFYTWHVPNTPSTNCLIKVKAGDWSCSDISDAPFTLSLGKSITLHTPNGGETMEVGSTFPITWSSTGNIENVDISYKILGDNTTSYGIANNVPNTGSFNWTVPNRIGTQYVLYVTDVGFIPSDKSDGIFSIVPARTITVLIPNGGESLEPGVTLPITWSSTGTIANVKIEYSLDNGSSWNTITTSTPNSGAFNWTVPNSPSSNCFIKVNDASGPANDSSNTTFSIQTPRSLTLLSPNGGETVEPGAFLPITWTSTGAIADVKLEYSLDNGSSWNTITPSTPNSGAFSWTAPNSPTTTCVVRVSDITGAAFDHSNATFVILAARSITLLSPNGGESVEVGSVLPLSWSYTGSIPNIRIEYSTDNGSSWDTIIASTANTGSINWTVPDAPSAHCFIKVGDAAGTATDTNNGSFTILAAKAITLLSPNGGESWVAATSHPITWATTGAISLVKIQYSTNNGSTWATIHASTANTGSYDWTVANLPSTACLVKVSDAAGIANDSSDAPFSITPVTIPSSERDALMALYTNTNGDSWTNKTNWRKPGDPSQFNDPGTEHTWYGVTLNFDKSHVTTISLTSNNLTGTCPNLNNLTALKTLRLTNNKLTGDISTAFNALPALAEFNMGSNQFTGNFPDLSASTQLLILDVSNSKLSGPIPTWLNTLTKLYFLYMPNTNLSGAIPELGNLTNLQTFALNGSLITGNFPAFFSQLTQLSYLRISYTNISGPPPDLSNLTQLDYCDLSYNKLSGPLPSWITSLTLLDTLYLSNNQFTGTIPDLSSLTSLTRLYLDWNQLSGNIPPSLNTLNPLRELDLSHNQLTGSIPDLSNLANLTRLRLGANQLSGTLPAFLTTLTQLVHLELSMNYLSGPIPSAMGNLVNLKYLYMYGNSLAGEIPTTLTQLTQLPKDGLCLFFNSLYTNDTSLKTFLNTVHYTSIEENQTIAPSALVVTQTTADTVSLSWTALRVNLSTGGYRVYYSSTPGTNYTLAGTTADLNATTYTITGLQPNTQYYIALKAVSPPHNINPNTLVSEYSTEVSTTTLVNKAITLLTPNGGESPEVGSIQPITWSNTGTIPNVKIEYSTNGGSSWTAITTSTTNSGSYNWTVPNAPSTNCLIKVTDAAGTAFDSSNAPFTIATQRTLTLTAPNGGQSWSAGTTQAITWTSTGTVANVAISYSTNNGSSWNTIQSSIANTGSYSWVTPSLDSSTCLVKVSDTVTTASDTSNSTFSIWRAPSITVTAPNGGESWKRSTTRTITWTSTGNIATVKLQYTLNGGTSWTTITTSTTNSGTYSWLLPSVSSNKTACKVKIIATGVTATDTSNANFTILK